MTETAAFPEFSRPSLALGPAPRGLRGRTGTHRGISFPMWSCIFEASIFFDDKNR
jgi:hypothetical protein